MMITLKLYSCTCK